MHVSIIERGNSTNYASTSVVRRPQLLSADSLATKIKDLAEKRNVFFVLGLAAAGCFSLLGVASFVFDPRQITGGIFLLSSANSLMLVRKRLDGETEICDASERKGDTGGFFRNTHVHNVQ